MTQPRLPRAFGATTQALLACIPESEPRLRTEITKILANAGYTPPEQVRGLWMRVTAAVVRELSGRPVEPWMREAHRTWTERDLPADIVTMP